MTMKVLFAGTVCSPVQRDGGRWSMTAKTDEDAIPVRLRMRSRHAQQLTSLGRGEPLSVTGGLEIKLRLTADGHPACQEIIHVDAVLLPR